MDQINVILATYNGSKYIKEQIESILNNDYPNVKIWVFDDGSTDGTDEIVKQYERDFSGKINFQKNSENKGLTRNFLEGVSRVIDLEKEKIHHKYFKSYYMFSDQDDVWHKDKIKKTLYKMKSMEKRKGDHLPIAVFTDALVVDEHLNLLNTSFHNSNKLDVTKTDLPHLLMENKLIGCTIMFNQPLVQKLDQQDKEGIRFHDWWIALIATSFGYIGYVKDATLSYRQHGRNIVGDQSFKKYMINRLVHIKNQRKSVEKNMTQANSFLATYEASLGNKEKEILLTFININTQNWLLKRINILKYGFLKTGFIRNLGLFLCI